MRSMTATPSQARKGDSLTVTPAQQHASHEPYVFENQPQAIQNNPIKVNNVTLPQSAQVHHTSPPRRRYPTLITFLNGRPTPHPLRIPPGQSPIHKTSQGVCLPPLRAQPAIIANVTATESCHEDGLRKDVLQEKQGKKPNSVLVAGKRFSRWLVGEDRVLVNAYRKHGNDWRTISNLLPGRSALAVRKRFHGKIRDQFGFTLDGVKDFGTNEFVTRYSLVRRYGDPVQTVRHSGCAQGR